MKGCSNGTCIPIALGDMLGLKCTTCNRISKGGFRDWWSYTHLGIVKSLASIFAAISGYSFNNLIVSGIKIGKNTWSKLLKDIGFVCAEYLERDRQNPENRF